MRLLRRRKDAETVSGTAASDEAVRVSAEGLIALHQAARLLPLRAGAVRARQAGSYVSAFKGRGMEFDEVRPYLPGDDVRSLDWRVTARTGKPHTKLFREERERPVLVWVDYRKPMFFATRGAYKAVVAARAAALLAWSAVAHGDRLGGMVFSEQDHLELRPGQGKAAALHLIRHLAEHPAWDAEKRGSADSDAPWSLARLHRVARPGSLIFLISDFRGLDARAEANLKDLSRHSDLVLIFVHDPLEKELPPAGNYRLSDGARDLTIDTGDTRLRSNHSQRFMAHEQRLKALCSRNSMFLLPCSTSCDITLTLQQGLRLTRA